MLDIVIYVVKLSGAIGIQGPGLMLLYLAVSGFVLTRSVYYLIFANCEHFVSIETIKTLLKETVFRNHFFQMLSDHRGKPTDFFYIIILMETN